MAATLTQLAANLAKSNLAANLSSGGTSLSVTPGTGALFPVVGTNQFFALTLKDVATGTFTEIVYVTARSGDTFTIVRAQEGTSARAWLAGDQANNLFTAGSFSNLTQSVGLQQQPGNYAQSSGNSNLVVTLSTVPAALTAGLTLRVRKNGNANTGAATLNVNGLGATPIVHQDLTATITGDLPANSIFTVVYDGTTNFVLQGANAGISSTQLQQQAGNYGADTSGTANALVVTLSPAPANLAAMAAAPIRITKSSTANTGTCSLALNGFAVTPIIWGDGSPMGVGDLPANSLFTVAYDGSANFIMQSVPFVPPMFADVQAQLGNYVADTGSGSNIYVVTLGPALVAPVVGMPIRTRIAHSNSGASTLNVNGLGAVAIHDSLGNALKANALRAGMIAEFFYDGTFYQLAVPAFAASIASSGNFVLPGGLWLQWGTLSVSPSNTFFNAAISFPASFPTACFICIASSQNKFDNSSVTTGGAQDVCIVHDLTTSGATVRIDTNDSLTLSGTHTIMWFAIGN